ncbi:MAG: hypothetical protein K9L30_15860 [Desulfobacterales bacterium]|nr:hypothetical protein [Desulfobacterales bacterium]
MKSPFLNDEIIEILKENLGSGQAGQGLDAEQLLLNLLMNPVRISRKRVRMVENPEMRDVVSEVHEGTIINDRGMLEDISEEVIYVNMLDDGSSLNSHGITKCQKCKGIIHEKNLQRCICGKTCCVSCGFYSKKLEMWFCSRIHALLFLCKINPRWLRFWRKKWT